MKINYLDQDEFLDFGEEIYPEEIGDADLDQGKNYQAFMKGWDSEF